jgi:alcohol dehydrogenase YqhD (iron-dependent ADH family)
MDTFRFYNPTRIHFGTGMIKNIGPEMSAAGVKKCLLVAGGGSIRANSVYSQVVESLKSSHIDWIEALEFKAVHNYLPAFEVLAIPLTRIWMCVRTVND